MGGEFNLDQYMMHHMTNRYEWDLPGLPTIHLPPFLSLHALMILLCAAFLLFLFGVVYDKRSRVPRGVTNLLELIILFVRDDIVYPNLGEEDGRKMMPLFCNFFFFILFLNLFGIIPVFATATSNINVTAALALISFCFMVFGSIQKNGLPAFFKALMPSGILALDIILFLPLELFGLLIKAFALMIRLFANMLAGHIVIISLLGIVVLMGAKALPAVGLAVMIYMLEVMVAVLQAYIFTLLSAMFVGQMYHPAH